MGEISEPSAEPQGSSLTFGIARRIFFRLLGLVYLAAFGALAVQVLPLMGSRGLAPVADMFEPGPLRDRWHEITLYRPTIFRLGHSDAWLTGTAWTGAALALFLAVGAPRRFRERLPSRAAPLLAPGPYLAILWFLYLSFVTPDRGFLGFQWDNLLLETGLLALLLAPWRFTPDDRPEAAPSRVVVFLFHFLVFRLNFESGLCKLLTGDVTWRDLTAMNFYYETAPLPAAPGWHAHNLPGAWHAAEVVLTFLVELLAAALVLGPRPFRLLALAPLLGLQVVIALTANYGIFNFLSAALLVLLIDDDTFRRAGALLRRLLGIPPKKFAAAPIAPAPPEGRRRRIAARFVVFPLVAFYAAMTYGAFFEAFVPPLEPGEREGGFHPFRSLHDSLILKTASARRLTGPLRSINRYHLFGTMTIDRYEIEIQESNDGETWETCEFGYKPGDPARRPRRAAPFHPRLDFQCWFLLLRPRSLPVGTWEAALADPRFLSRVTRENPWFETLLIRLLSDPGAVAPLFERLPFGDTPPRLIRVRVHRYTMTTRADRATGGYWWDRELVATWGPLNLPEAPAPGRAVK